MGGRYGVHSALSSLISCVVDCCIFFFVIVVIVVVIVMSSPLLPHLLSRSPPTFSGRLLFCIYLWPPLVVIAASALNSLPIGGDGSVVVDVVVVVVSPYSSPEAPFTARHCRHQHVSTLSRCTSLFFNMLGNCVYSSETTLNSI